MDAERLAQPQAEGDQFVARRQGRVVVVGAAIGRPAAIGSERHGDVAEGRGAEGEACFDCAPSPLAAGHLPVRAGSSAGAPIAERHALPFSPLFAGRWPAGHEGRRCMGAIVVGLPHAASTAAVASAGSSDDSDEIFVQAQPVAATLDQIEQFARRLRNPFNGIALVLQVMQHGKH